jgi:phosphonate transport system substrate-binding protein
MKKLALILIASAILVSMPLSDSAQPAQEEILIGLIPELNVFKQMERFRPLADYLSEQTGVKVKLTILSRYGNIIESFISEKMDGAFFGSFTGGMAIKKLGLEPIARPVNLDGESTYHGHLYTRKDTGIKNIQDMRGRKMAFVERATTAGYVFPLAYLRENGIQDMGSFFEEFFFAGSHDASLIAVLDGKADIGASKNTVFDWVRENDSRVDKEIVILAESAKVPSNGLCVRRDLDDNLKQKLKEVLLKINQSAEGKDVQAGIDIEKYQYKNE